MVHPVVAVATGVFAAAVLLACRPYRRSAPGKPAPAEIDTWEGEGGCVLASEGKTQPQVPQTTPAG